MDDTTPTLVNDCLLIADTTDDPTAERAIRDLCDRLEEVDEALQAAQTALAVHAGIIDMWGLTDEQKTQITAALAAARSRFRPDPTPVAEPAPAPKPKATPPAPKTKLSSPGSCRSGATPTLDHEARSAGSLPPPPRRPPPTPSGSPPPTCVATARRPATSPRSRLRTPTLVLCSARPTR